jgi:hypothetical protein
MMRRSLGLWAAGFVVAGFCFASPAQASYRVIKWNVTNVCEIWNYGLSGPLLPDYRIMTGPLPSFGTALRAKHRLLRQRKCP